VNASRGERLRAEPVAVPHGDPDDRETWGTAVTYHVSEFEVLEDQIKSCSLLMASARIIWMPASLP
jgi:hypothetical protein